eukprot:5691580-Lingulodinium_polyedra.AAC.1
MNLWQPSAACIAMLVDAWYGLVGQELQVGNEHLQVGEVLQEKLLHRRLLLAREAVPHGERHAQGLRPECGQLVDHDEQHIRAAAGRADLEGRVAQRHQGLSQLQQRLRRQRLVPRPHGPPERRMPVLHGRVARRLHLRHGLDKRRHGDSLGSKRLP